jgi:GNAT superfamily N-acetyltransferase
MSLTRETLVEAIQTSMHIWDEAAPVFTRLEIPGLRGQIGPTPYPPLNLLGMARLDQATADAVIQAVIERFAAEAKGFAWVVGPSTTPADLAARLEAAGLHKEVEFAGMALTDLSQPVPANPAIRIEEASFEAMREAADMMAAAFGFVGMTPEDAAGVVDAFAATRDRYRSRGYLAFSEEGDRAVGFSFMSDTDVPGIVWLGGASTLEEYRGRGIYRSFVAKRAADARADGAQAAVIQAVRGTSAPICQRIGFTELCSLEAYVWMPADA